MPGKLTLVSHKLCPYVQRAAIALAEKGVAFDRVSIDLDNKPDWFKAISPLGKVPLLRVDDEVLFESSVIVEYLEETQPNPLHPRDPLTRARHRAWMEFGSSILSDLWIYETTADRALFESKTVAMQQKFARLEDVLAEGPYFAGRTFTLVDAVFAPIFRYFAVFDALADTGILEGHAKVQGWSAALARRASVVSAVDEAYPRNLESFVRKHNGVLARAWPSSSAGNLS